MKRIIIISLLSLVLLIEVRGQDLSCFDFPLYTEKVTLCEAIEKYGNNSIGEEDFKFVKIGKRMHSIVLKYENGVFENKAFALLRDTISSSEFSLNQIGLSSKEYQLKEKNFNLLLKETNRLLDLLEEKYGPPTKLENLKDRYYGQENDHVPGKIIKATWDKNNIKLQIKFAKDGPYNHYFYSLKIRKFKDYIGNMKLPEGWTY